jgi:hypothetical protein
MIDDTTRTETERRIQREFDEFGDPALQLLWCSVDVPGALPRDGLLVRTATRLVFVAPGERPPFDPQTWALSQLGHSRQTETLYGVRLSIPVPGGELGIEGFPRDEDAERFVAGLQKPTEREDEDTSLELHLAQPPPTVESPQEAEPVQSPPRTGSPRPDPWASATHWLFPNRMSGSEQDRIRMALVLIAVVVMALIGIYNCSVDCLRRGLASEKTEPAISAVAPTPPEAPTEPPPQPVPDNEPAPADEPAPLENSEMVQLLVGHDPGVHGCFLDAVDAGQIDPGLYPVQIVVRPDGTVHAVTLEDQALWGSDLAHCLQDKISPILMPAPGKTATQTWIVPFDIGAPRARNPNRR